MAGTDQLADGFREMAEELFRVLHAYDARFVITSSLRTRQEQQELYSRMLKNREAGLPYFTTLPPGKSQHERGLAIDVVRFGIDPHTDPLLVEAGTEWRKLGGTWGGTADPIHFGAPRGW